LHTGQKAAEGQDEDKDGQGFLILSHQRKLNSRSQTVNQLLPHCCHSSATAGRHFPELARPSRSFAFWANAVVVPKGCYPVAHVVGLRFVHSAAS
jgi:hypothetical protein